MKSKMLIVLSIAASVHLTTPLASFAETVPVLGSAQDYAVLGATTVTNTGPTVVFGSNDVLANVGVYESGGANATTGFSSSGNTFVGSGSNSDGPGIVNAPAAIHLGDAGAQQAQNDLSKAYTALLNYGTATDLSGDVLGSSGTVSSLVPGVYSFSSTAQLDGTLQLNAGGINGGVWIFDIGTSLTTASDAGVQLINPGSNLGSDDGVFWVVGSSATLGTDTTFEGNILAQTSITLNTGATLLNGRALAETGAVTLDDNTISDICPSTADLPPDVTGPGSTAPNSGPGFSSGIGFNSDDQLVLLGSGGTTTTAVPLPPSAAMVLALLPIAWWIAAKKPLGGDRACGAKGG